MTRPSTDHGPISPPSLRVLLLFHIPFQNRDPFFDVLQAIHLRNIFNILSLANDGGDLFILHSGVEKRHATTSNLVAL